MSPSQQAKSAGLNSLAEAQRISGVPLRTLRDWHDNKPLLFEIVLLGCVAKRLADA